MDGVHFVLFDISEALVEAWRHALEKHVPETARSRFTIKLTHMEDESFPEERFDCVVSPANSYGRLDGSFDYFLALQLAPPGEGFDAPTRIAQSVLYHRWKGYAPPGTCTLVPLADTSCTANKYGCRFIALCPTMRVPQSATWNRDVVYNCTWSLLNAIDQHNVSVEAAGDAEAKIRKVLMTGLATGVGGVSAERCAEQTALAVKHYLDACADPEKWSSLQWKDALAYDRETSRTYSL